MADITVSITSTQQKCLEYSVYSVQDWSENLIHNRARVAQEEIIAKLVAHCNSKNIALATGVEAQITQAYSLGVVDTAKNVSDKLEIK
tara:strand:+ start:595 stop:858 length:264 start_codon:yes stop_codon:yes gene_type:complete